MMTKALYLESHTTTFDEIKAAYEKTRNYVILLILFTKYWCTS